MKILRRLSYVALAVAFTQIVFGAIVRITGSGWGCGEHWPKCAGYWFPPLDRPDLIVELAHRYLALFVTVAAAALAYAAWKRRDEAGVGGRGGVLRPAVGALGVVVATALLGAVTIKLRLNPFVIVAHLALAMSLLATIVVAGVRAGGFGAPSAVALSADAAHVAAAAKSWRVARIAAILAFVVLVFGALTANLGAAGACLGFPTCRVFRSENSGLVHLQLTHRVLAFLFAFHMLGAAMMIRRRAVAPVVKRAAWIALGAVVLQILVAAALVETRLPPALQSLHQAVGTLVWIAVVIYASLAARAASADPARLTREPDAVAEPPEGRVARRREATGVAAKVATPPSVTVVAAEPQANARLVEIERAARAYEAAMSALVAEAEASLVEDEAEIADDVSLVAEVEPEPEPVLESNFALYVETATAVSELRAEAVIPPEALPPEPPAVAMPESVVAPVQSTTPPKRPHSVAVIVARGADF